MFDCGSPKTDTNRKLVYYEYYASSSSSYLLKTHLVCTIASTDNRGVQGYEYNCFLVQLCLVTVVSLLKSM